MKTSEIKNKTARQKLLEAIESAEVTSITEICKKAGVSRVTFYLHYSNDPKFQAAYLNKQQAEINKKLELIAA